MIIDEKGKLFGKISIIDIVVVLALVIAIGGCAYKFLGGSDTVNVAANDEFTTVIVLEGVRDFMPEAMEEGEAVYEMYGGKLGTITKIETEPYTKIIGDREVHETTYTDRYNVYITLNSTGSVNSKGYFAGGNSQIYAGGSIQIQSRLFSTEEAKVFAVYQ